MFVVNIHARVGSFNSRQGQEHTDPYMVRERGFPDIDHDTFLTFTERLSLTSVHIKRN